MNRILLFAICLSLVNLSVSAGVIYSNITPCFPELEGLSAYGATGGFVATEFTTTGGGPLASIGTDLVQTGGASPASAGLYTDASGAPGALLESWSSGFPFFNYVLPPPLTTLASVSHPVLSPGTTYWFVVNEGLCADASCPGAASSEWFYNDEGVTGGIWQSTPIGGTLANLTNNFNSNPTPGIELIAIPEPSTGTLLVLAIIILTGAVCRCSRKSGIPGFL